jgi:predicted nucleic acid-binding protein
MAAYVVDTSVVMKILLKEEDTPYARGLMRSGLVSDNELIVPDFCLLECANVIWKHVRLFGIPADTGRRLISELMGFPLEIMLSADFIADAYQIGLAHNLAVYDSIYIALARSLDCPLITVDARQAAAAQAEQVTLKAITDFTPQNLL